MCTLIGKNSSSAHELLLHFLLGRSRSVLLLCRPAGAEVVLDRRRGELLPLDPEGPRQCPATECEGQALGGGVQVRSPAGCPSLGIGEDLEARTPVTSDDSQQLELRGPLPATHAGADASRDGVGGHASARAFE